jgi:hypothetical protein
MTLSTHSRVWVHVIDGCGVSFPVGIHGQLTQIQKVCRHMMEREFFGGDGVNRGRSRAWFVAAVMKFVLTSEFTCSTRTTQRNDVPYCGNRD